MIKLVAQPNVDMFEVFDLRMQPNSNHHMWETPLGVLSREEIVEMFSSIQLKVHLDGEHESMIRNFLSAKTNRRTLFQEAIEAIK